jgi:hypothetical protein
MGTNELINATVALILTLDVYFTVLLQILIYSETGDSNFIWGRICPLPLHGLKDDM